VCEPLVFVFLSFHLKANRVVKDQAGGGILCACFQSLEPLAAKSREFRGKSASDARVVDQFGIGVCRTAPSSNNTTRIVPSGIDSGTSETTPAS